MQISANGTDGVCAHKVDVKSIKEYVMVRNILITLCCVYYTVAHMV